MNSPFAWKGTSSQHGAALDRKQRASDMASKTTADLREHGKNLSPVPSLSKRPHGGAYTRAMPLVTEEQACGMDEMAGLA